MLSRGRPKKSALSGVSWRFRQVLSIATSRFPASRPPAVLGVPNGPATLANKACNGSVPKRTRAYFAIGMGLYSEGS